MKTGLTFEQRGNMILEWDQQLSYITMDSSNSLKFTNFELIAPRLSIAAEEVKLTGNAYFNLNLQQGYNFELQGTNQITLTNFEANIQKWSGSIGYAKSFGNFDINLEPNNKKYEFNSTSNLQLDSFNLMYDDSNPDYDTEFAIDALVLVSGGSIWFDFGSFTPKFNIQDSYQLSLDDLHFAIGSTVDFSITSFTTAGAGQIYTELNNQHLYVFTNMAFNWDIDIQTLNYGHWQVDGSYSGCGSMTLTEWTPGQSGQVAFSVITPLHHDLQIVRNDLVIDLGTLNLNSGSATIKWQREQPSDNGYFNLTNNGIAGSLALLKINFTNTQNPFEFETGNITIQPGTLYMDWQKQTNIKMLHINNGLTINLALVKLKWGDKTITIGDISLNPGQFKIVYDTLNKTITLKNSMNAFGPLCTYEDADRKLSVDLLNLINDYSKTMTLKWYEDASNKIVGLYLDTDKVNLVDWIVFESIKYDPNGATGRRIALGGFQADDFKIMKNANDKLEISGYLYIANHITYSRLVNLSNDVWEDLDVQWDLTSSLKWIKFESDFDVSIILLSLDLFGIQFTSEFDLTNYLEVKWALSGDASQYKEFYFDTNGQVLSSVNFIILGPNNRGIQVVGGGIWAEDFYVKWKLWPPLQADIIVGGTIGYETATVYGTIDGNTWIEIWPFASGSQHD
jgi:hypothetical protein